MQASRRRTLALIGAAAVAPSTRAQSRALRILVGFAPGGAADVVAREVAESMRTAGYVPIVENRPGAAGRLAIDLLLQAPADGHTLVLMPGGNMTIFPLVYRNLKYRPEDLAPVASVCDFGFAFSAGPGTPARTLDEFVRWAKAHPDKASYGSSGGGTAMHFMGVMLAREAGIDLTHVPYRGGAAAMVDLLGGTIPAVATTLPAVVSAHREGRLRILAHTNARPVPSLAGVPTFAAAGYPGLVITETFGFYAAAATPATVLDTLNRDLTAAASSERVKSSLGKLEFGPLALGRAAFAARIAADRAKWGPVVESTGYHIDE